MALQRLGYRLDLRWPRFGDRLPETLDGHAGAMIFGGPQSANDEDDFIRREVDWIAVPLREQRPFLGICLGAQMMARQFGARVDRHPLGRCEVGYYPIRPTMAGRKVCPAWPERVYQWHREGFDCPTTCELLAEGSADFPVQAIRYHNAYGVQFHPDVTHAMMHRWLGNADVMLDLPGAQRPAAHFRHRARHDDAESRWLDDFLGRWLGSEQPAANEQRASYAVAAE